MSEPIVSRQTIALQAERAARFHVNGGPRLPNPYCAHMEPEHHREYDASFERCLHNLTAPEAEGSA